MLVTQSHVTLCDPKDCSPPGSSVCGILQAGIMELPSPGDLPNPGVEPGSPALQAGSLLSEPRKDFRITGEHGDYTSPCLFLGERA